MGGSKLTPETKSAIAMAGLCLFMGPFVFLLVFSGRTDPLAGLGFREPMANTALAWLAGLAVAAAYIVFCTRMPAVKAWLFRPHPLKFLALVLAVLAATLEEIAFRRLLMDWLERSGSGAAVQVLVSGVGFGFAHIVWGGLKGSWTAALGSIAATSVLGLGLAIVYLLGNRALAPCIMSHFMVTALIEPGLLIAAFSGQLGVGPPPDRS